MREYLKAAHRLGPSGQPITVTALADAQGVAPASATAMVKKLARMGFMNHAHYGSIELTDDGRKQALLAIRRHRLLECFLVRMLHLSIHEVHDESHRLEPAISDLIERKMDEALGRPTRCPHGDPIPDANGNIVDPEMGRPLSELREGDLARVLRVPGSKTDLLRYLTELGIEPEKEIQLVKREPFGGPLHLRLGRRTVMLGPEAAESVFVVPGARQP